ncbi:Malate/lactate/ureidoglycolate dehydrogenase, LDH2 family [Pseudooceanicola antarcticus]|uniref:Malate dehydrogenase n=1 Tax=Pseudooceanicola antarcticus TaxID=1247613 RepID=A0A285HLH3_9RHOB|nr:Ldh family oxidoreductase [Pseudooceanicola antarcticus]PJE27964.1 malate dehydrogenase [Pseudooceanicola antarcticus]SNY35616.1 Malate/lactate/ureidoglycolate dehydrogenase, LDH2 family [Pseudooceanicola antarcticus]
MTTEQTPARAITMTNVEKTSLRAFVAEGFEALGLTAEDAGIFADALIFSELRFHPGQGQGVMRLRRYQERINNGEVAPRAPWTILKEAPSLALVDAHNGIGTVAASKAMDLAVKKAKENGIGTVVVRNSTHYGSSAVHACRALEAGCIGIAFTNAGPEMAPWGGREGVTGTNPWSIAAPSDKGFPAVLDIALTTAGKGMMNWYLREGKKMPLDWALTPEGEETDDPAAAMKGALLGIGGHKGYGLAFMTEALTGVLSGAGFGLTPYADPKKLDVSHMFIALDISWFMEPSEYEARMGQFIEMAKSRALRPGFDEILVPGEQEARREASKSENGVPIADSVLEDFRKLGPELGLKTELKVLGAYTGDIL